MSEKLKPCPFCGNEFLGVRVVAGTIEEPFTHEARVTCHNCGAEGKHIRMWEDILEEEIVQKAVAGWNERWEGEEGEKD